MEGTQIAIKNQVNGQAGRRAAVSIRQWAGKQSKEGKGVQGAKEKLRKSESLRSGGTAPKKKVFGKRNSAPAHPRGTTFK